MTSPQEKILIVGPSWVGDMVMAQSLFKVLKQLSPDCIIDVLAPAWSLPILERMPEVRRGVTMPVGHGSLRVKDRYRLGVSLRAEKYTRSIALPNSLKSAFVPAFAKIPVRSGWRGEMRYGWLNDIRVLDKEAIPLMVERFTALAYGKSQQAASGGTKLSDIPKPKLVIDKENIQPCLEKHGINQSKPILALCPGAEFGGSKRWPEAYYAEVAAEKLKDGWQVWIFGSENDRPVADKIKSLLPAEYQAFCYALTGKTELAEAVDLMSLAEAVVSNDSGLMHIAAALDLPLVVVYGSTSPGFTPPLGDKIKILNENIDCAPCFARECPKIGADNHLCMKELKAIRVMAAINELSSADVCNGEVTQ